MTLLCASTRVFASTDIRAARYARFVCGEACTAVPSSIWCHRIAPHHTASNERGFVLTVTRYISSDCTALFDGSVPRLSRE